MCIGLGVGLREEVVVCLLVGETAQSSCSLRTVTVIGGSLHTIIWVWFSSFVLRFV